MKPLWGGLFLVAFAVFMGAAASGQIRVHGPRAGSFRTNDFTLYYTSDPHFRVGPPTSTYLVNQVHYINADPKAIGLIVGGDFAQNFFSGRGGWDADAFLYQVDAAIAHTKAESLAFCDSVYHVLNDSLNVPVYPVLGNWEISRLANTGCDYPPCYSVMGQEYDSTGVMASPKQWNDFASNFPGNFASWENSANRGKRHYGVRLKDEEGNETNILFFSFFNVNKVDSSWYEGNCPVTGYDPNSLYGFKDFDGFHDSTSTQRQDFAKFMADNYHPGDWVFFSMHRPIVTFANSERYQDPHFWDAGHGLANWMNDWLTAHPEIRRYVMLVGDTHELMWLDLKSAHCFQVHSTIWGPRAATDLAQMSDSGWASDVKLFRYSDTSSVALMNTIRRDSSSTRSMNVLTQFHFLNQTEATITAILFVFSKPGNALLYTTPVATYSLRRDR